MFSSPHIQTMVRLKTARRRVTRSSMEYRSPAALLLAACLWPVTRWWVKSVLVLYAGAMALALIYTGEHYVIDVVAGWLTAGLALRITTARRRAACPAVKPSALRPVSTGKVSLKTAAGS